MVGWIFLAAYLAAAIGFAVRDIRSLMRSALWPIMRSPSIILYSIVADLLFWWVYVLQWGLLLGMDLVVTEKVRRVSKEREE